VTAGDEHGSGSQQSHEWGSHGPAGPGQPGYGYVPVPQPPRRRWAPLISYVAVAAVAACCGGLAVGLTSSSGRPPSASAGLRPGSGASAEPGAVPTPGADISSATLQRVESAVQPGLVVINSELQDDGADVSGAAGTGMIVSSSGLVLTNNHVINATNGLSATVVATHKTYPAMWLGYDKGSDIAVIKPTGPAGLRR
jgi:S1-C subfamily serine protease